MAVCPGRPESSPTEGSCNEKFALIATALFFALTMMACSSSTGGGGGGGDGTRIFESDDLGNGANFSHTFPLAAVIPYFCRYHGSAGGVGMSGTITVSVPGMPYTPITIPVSINSSLLPDLAINEGDTVVWTNNSGVVHTVESDN